MGRSTRIQAPDTVYHVVCRGNNRQEIFLENRDYFRYLDLWRKHKPEMDIQVFAYVLMNNHVHWLIKTGSIPLSEVIQRVHGVYARWFNHRHQRVGHLFQSRFKSLICDEDKYLLTLAQYIHLNPVRAGLVKQVHRYPWSSYPCYCGDVDSFVDTSFLLTYFSRDLEQARREFSQFVEQIPAEEFKHLVDFTTKKEKRQSMPLDVTGKKNNLANTESKQTTNQQVAIRGIELDDIAAWVTKATGVLVDELKGKSKQPLQVRARNLFIRIAVGEAGVKRTAVALYLNKDRSLVTKTLEKWYAGEFPAGDDLLNQFRKEFQQIENFNV